VAPGMPPNYQTRETNLSHEVGAAPMPPPRGRLATCAADTDCARHLRFSAVAVEATRPLTTQGCERRPREVSSVAAYLGFRRTPMTTLFAVVGGWIVLNAAFAAALLTRRNRPGLRARLVAWVFRGERRPKRPTRTAQAHNGQ